MRLSPIKYIHEKTTNFVILYKNNTRLEYADCNLLTKTLSVSLVARATIQTPSSYMTNSQS